MDEVDPFLQPPPVLPNRWRTDRALRMGVERLLGPEAFGPAAKELDDAGERSVQELAGLALRAEANPPRHVAYDAWGRRVDQVEVDPSWTSLVAACLELGLAALPYEAPYGPASRVVQAALAQILEATTATALCPVSMTDGAAAALLRHDPDLAARYVPRLTSRTEVFTSGQWMTEKAGGSDVSRSHTTACPVGGGQYALRGTKWFTSATTADVAVALARPEGAEPGSRGLSLFLLELRDPDGGWNHLRVRRLKDKLGTRALPTAELDLDGTLAVPVGGLGRGVPKVASVLSVARVWAAQAGAGTAGQALALARDYAWRREVLGAPLARSPVHTRWIAQLAARHEAMVVLALDAAALLGAAERGGAGERAGEAGLLARIVVPLAKLATARQGVGVVSELLESFGGAGYLEDTGLPRLLRDVHVQCIWEGTTNVLALDAVRALRDPEVQTAYLDEVDRLLDAEASPATQAATERIRATLTELRPLVREPVPDEARRLGWGMARTYQAAVLANQAGWALRTHADPRSATALSVLLDSGPLLDPPSGADSPALAALAGFGEPGSART